MPTKLVSVQTKPATINVLDGAQLFTSYNEARGLRSSRGYPSLWYLSHNCSSNKIGSESFNKFVSIDGLPLKFLHPTTRDRRPLRMGWSGWPDFWGWFPLQYRQLWLPLIITVWCQSKYLSFFKGLRKWAIFVGVGEDSNPVFIGSILLQMVIFWKRIVGISPVLYLRFSEHHSQYIIIPERLGRD
jgi:hypothetical protein